jgi:hypothetical protein
MFGACGNGVGPAEGDPPGGGVVMGVTFRRRISWPENDLLFPAELFNVTVPPGLCSMDVRVPNIVDINKMNQLSSGAGYSSSSGGLSSAYGFVNPKLTAIFPNPAAQWRRTPAPGAKNSDYGPCQFQFTGGEVILDLTLEIYVITAAEIDPNDDLSVQIFACVYEHELLHVVDALDIVNNWLPPRLNMEPDVARYLGQGQPYVYGTSTMRASQLEKEFRTSTTNPLQASIFNLWATESNRRESLRDTPAQYKIVSDKVNALQGRQANRPHH